MKRGAGERSVLSAGRAGAAALEQGAWAQWAVLAILGVTALRLGLNALNVAPMHFDESQYWTYGEALDWGYYSKPPMVAWLIRASTEILGDTPFGVRFFAPLLHGAIAWMIFAAARRLFDGRTGFWAALVYLAAPGVSFSAGVMSTDPPMMLGWAVALYALVRAMEREAEARSAALWWLVMGAAVGFGLLSKYTIVAFLGGALGYALFAREAGPIWRAPPRRAEIAGPLLALLAALLVFSPNLAWNAAHDFASITHVGDNTKLGEGAAFRLDKLAEFFGAQFGVFGPIAFGALLALAVMGRWRHEWPYRLLLWMALPLLIAITIQAFLARAHPNWAAPVYIAASILVAAWLLDLGRRGLLIVSTALGALAAMGFFALAATYGQDASALPRAYDPLKKTRHFHAICARAAALREGRRYFGTDRRLLADCLFAEGIGIEMARTPPNDNPGNHYALKASLQRGSAAAREETFLLVMRGTPERVAGALARFETAEILESGAARTHRDRFEPYVIASVRGWRE